MAVDTTGNLCVSNNNLKAQVVKLEVCAARPSP
jgi:hypothetical protein